MTFILDVPGSNPPNPLTTSIQEALLATNRSSTLDATAARLVSSITISPDPARALWTLWDAFFTAVVTSSTSHEPHLALLDAVRAQSPTQPNNLSSRSDAERRLYSYTGPDKKLNWQALPRFDAQWRDVHDILEAWRDWDGEREPSTKYNTPASTLPNSGDIYFLRFCRFSAALLKATKDQSEVHPVWVFYAARNMLESHGPLFNGQAKPHRLTPEQTWALDIRVAAIWMRDGGRALREADHEELRRHWSPALDDKTELWPREDGLTRERWQLWNDRLWSLSTEKEILDEETRAVVTDAAGVVSRLLEETST